jgi:hypothetical protein
MATYETIVIYVKFNIFFGIQKYENTCHKLVHSSKLDAHLFYGMGNMQGI